ncbi:hypothetical protein EMCRGX_G035036 [Ephydatia muelleri]
MDDEILAVASQQTLSLFITEEHRAGGCGLLLGFGDLHECHWLSLLYNTFVRTGRDGPLQQLRSLLLRSQCLLTSDSSRSIAFDAGLTCDRSSSEQQGQLTVADATMHSVRHLVHTIALHVNSSGCERMLEHSAHFSFFKIDRLFALAKVGLGSCNKAGGEAIF